MAFYIVEGDITKFEGDAIINSVGVESTIYGKVCQSILDAANSPKLQGFIDSVNDVYSVGEVFITDSYGLPVKKIVHLISPHAKKDPNCFLLKECIRRVFNECRARGLKKIGIPCIGTGANMYKHDEVESIITDMGMAYCNIFPGMEITLVTAKESTSLANRERLSKIKDAQGNERYHDDKTWQKFLKGSHLLWNTAFPKGTSSSNQNINTKAYWRFEKYPSDIKIPKVESLKTIEKYIDRFAELKRKKDSLFPGKDAVRRRIDVYFGYDKNGKASCVNAGSGAYSKFLDGTPNKKGLMRIALALRMTKLEAKNFLNQFGFSFAVPGFNKFDDNMEKLLRGRKYGIVEIEEELNCSYASLFS